ncbi:MAG: lipopolysaccharide biosynthesis protein [Rubricoccaceae bacterium]
MISEPPRASSSRTAQTTEVGGRPYEAPSVTEKHVRTDEVRTDLRARTLRSGAVMMAAQPLRLILGVGATALLARLLSPSDFGLIAMVTPLLPIIAALQNAGFETATVQRESATHDQVSVLFWLGLRINLALVAFLALAGPVLAWLYGHGELMGITWTLAGGILAVSLASQHESLMKRQMRFEPLTLIDLSSLAAGVGAAIAAALLGAGYWALVLEIVVMQTVRSGLLWMVCRWRPARPVRSRGLDATGRAMVSYGLHLTGHRLLTRTGAQLDRVLVGALSGATALGLYDMARRWAFFPFNKVYEPIFDVAVSSFSRAQHDPSLYRTYVRRGVLPVFALALPALAFAFAEADAIILLLLGEQWGDVVPLFQLLSVGVYVGTLQRITKWIYLAEGTTARQLRWGMISTPILISAVAIGAALGGPRGIALGFMLATVALTGPAVWYCLKPSPLSMQDLIAAVWRPFTASIAAAGLLLVAGEVLPAPDALLSYVVLRAGLYGGLYAVLWHILPGGLQASRDLLRFAREIRSPA